MRVLWGSARAGSVARLRWRLLAAVGGVTVTMVSCAGRSERDDTASGGSSAKGGTGVTGGAGGTSASGSGATGGSGAVGGTGTGGSSATGGVGGSVGGGGSNGGDSGAGSIGAGAAGFAGLGCNDPMPAANGIESCDGFSFVHRKSAVACTLPTRRGPLEQAGGAAGLGNEGGASGAPAEVPTHDPCAVDTDCTAMPNGYCVTYPTSAPLGPPSRTTVCEYACVTDADCSDGRFCACDGGYYLSKIDDAPVPLGICAQGDCALDADCGRELLCVAPVNNPCSTQPATQFHCQSPADECSAGTCITSSGSFGQCGNTGDHYVCSLASCGRPFLVEGALRVAELHECESWLDGSLAAAPLRELDETSRAAIARHFAQAGLMEHASIAAFARFTLQLLALGAPPELVAASTRAMADETRHAELCFGLAARYAGHAVGPGRLDVAGALGAMDLLSIVELVVAEGCIGETAAALEATWAAEAATDPLVRDVLRGIAADEEAHAGLAFRFVAWAGREDGRVPALVAAQLEQALAEDTLGSAERTRTSGACETDGRLAAQGVLSDRTRRDARSATLRDILPVLSARLAVPRPPAFTPKALTDFA